MPGNSGDENDGEGDVDPELPATREELYKLKERYGNNRRTAAHFYKNRAIQLELRMIYIGGRPLAHEFSATVKLFQKGQDPLSAQP